MNKIGNIKKIAVLPAIFFTLFLTEGHTVGALVHSGVGFVSANQDLFQGAVVSLVAVMCALLNGAFDAFICIAVHSIFLLFFRIRIL